MNVVTIDSAAENKREFVYCQDKKSHLDPTSILATRTKNMNRIESTCNCVFIIFMLNESEADVRNDVDSMSITSPNGL